MSDRLIGTTVAHYEVIEKLGGGAMGIVYRARDTRLGRHVALKFLPAMWMHDVEAKQRFVREAQAASATDHRNICTIHDIGSADDGRMFLVMALYEGPTLKQRLADGPVPVEEALDIATQVAEGLAKAHAAGVVHRDIKPGNLILTEDAVKIVDFGLAKFADSLHLTTAGTSLGTAAYMSPEQVRGDDVGPAGDVWAVGVILYEMLAGHPPFRGGYAEAIAHAIRHDPPAPLRAIRPEVPEEVEQVVFRALHKEPAVRYATGRELARALRMARGQSMPQDLLTQIVARPVNQPLSVLPAVEARRGRWRTALAAAAMAVVVATVGAATWAARPVPAVPVLVAPVANQTGRAELDGYRMALTHLIVRQLTDAPGVRVVPYATMLQTLRRFGAGSADVGSRDALQALTTAGRPAIVLLPTLLYENGAWRGRVEVRDAATAVAVRTVDTGAVVSSLAKETAYKLAGDMAGVAREYLEPGGLRGLVLRRTAAPSRLRTLDAERAFEAGQSWYEEQEFPRAYDAFTEAAREDPRSAIAQAWASRAAVSMRAVAQARAAGDAAMALVAPDAPGRERWFVEAVAAEARGDQATADARYASLVGVSPNDPVALLERASFRDRTANSRDAWSRAVQDYHAVLQASGVLIRPRVELCRLYNRLQEPASARQHGRAALDAASRAGWTGGEVLARFCLADSLRVGTEAERGEGRAQAERALALSRMLDHPYNLPRSLYYVGLAAASQARFPEAVSWWKQADAVAQAGRNLILQPLVLLNLGVASDRLGDATAAAEYYARSATAYEQLGDERRAAQQQANSGAFRIVYGLDVGRAVEDVRNALGVLQKLGDADFEVFGLETIGTYERYAGRTADAQGTLTRALAIARERNLDEKVASVSMALARLSLEQAAYDDARRWLMAAAGEGGRYGAQALTTQGLLSVRLGAFDEARRSLDAAAADLDRRDDAGLQPQLDVALAELAVETGRFDEARQYYARAAAWRNPRDESAVWARACVGWLDAEAGRAAASVPVVRAAVRSLDEMGRVRLSVAARVLLARTLLKAGRAAEARRVLGEREGADTTLGAELSAFVHYWRGRAAQALGGGDAAAEIAAARERIDGIVRALPESDRGPFTRRRDVRLVLEASGGAS